MLTVLVDPRKSDMDNPTHILKGIQVAVVCLLSLSNLTLIISKISRKGWGPVFFTARHSIQISLAFAGLVSALYSNLVNTIILFNMDNHGMNCMTTYLANVYFYTFVPIIYCTGLILLAIDLVLRFKSDVYKTLGKSRVYGILCAILPWAAAFSISCPLTLTDVQWHLKCANRQTNRHLQATVICSNIVPAGIVFFLALGVAATVRPKRFYDFQRSFNSPMYTVGKATTTSSDTDCSMNGVPGKTKGDCSSTGNGTSPIQIGSAVVGDDAYPSITNTKGKTVSREKCKLLFSMFFVVVLVLPYGGVFMYITMEYSRLFTTLLFYMIDLEPFVVYHAASNLQNLYQIVLPLVWLCTRY